MFYLLLFLATLVSAKALSPRSDAAQTLRSQTESLCVTPDCIHAASNILYNLHPDYTNIDPCTDFDQYVCGGWDERHDMRPDQGAVSVISVMAEEGQTKLRRILEASEAPSPEDSDNFVKLKAAYNACLNEAAVQRRGTKPLDEMLANIDKIYPAGTGSSEMDVKDNLTDAIIYLMEAGTEGLLGFSVDPDDRDPDNVAIFVSSPEQIGLPARETYNSTETVTQYTAVVKEVLGSFSDKKSKGVAADVVDFEKQIADASPDSETIHDVTRYYNPQSIKETQSLLPEISFSDIISKFAPSSYKGDRLIVISPSYMKSLSRILRKAPRETVRMYLRWKTIQKYVDRVEDPKVEPLRKLNNKFAGRDTSEERWRTCVQALDSSLGWILSRFFVLDAFPKSSKELGDQVVADIMERFKLTLTETAWMSPKVRELAIEKVKNIDQKIGYPTKSPNVLDAAEVNKYYKSLEISKDTYFENMQAAARFDLDDEWSQLGKPTDHDRWVMTASTINAYYNPTANELVFLAGIMQPPAFYGSSVPLYLTYGSFGAVAGHELTHAFDSSGRHYDQIGNYTDWWDDKTIKAFEERTECFVDQYSNFTVPGTDGELNVNGRLTLDENIADAGGLAAAFDSWKRRDGASPDSHLPGLSKFTKEQLFFMSFGNWWCSKVSKEQAERLHYVDPHAPSFARALGTTTNTRAFKEAFNCHNKEPVCKLW